MSDTMFATPDEKAIHYIKVGMFWSLLAAWVVVIALLVT